MRQAQCSLLVRAVQGHTGVLCHALRWLVSQSPCVQDSGTESGGISRPPRGFHVKATEGQTSGKCSNGLLEAPFASEV